MRLHLLAGSVLLVLLACAPAVVSAQAWRAEQQRLEAETQKLIEKARAEETPDAELSRRMNELLNEYLEKVVKPALAEARSCRQRMDAVALLIGIERQMQLLGVSSDASSGLLTSVLTEAYAEQTYERCMNELYRACVVEDNPMYTLTMVAWVLGAERQRQLLGVGSEDLDLRGELDPRITKCRGPWYQVRIVVERSGTEPDTGPWKDSDVLEGWMGRGLNQTRTRSLQRVSHPGDFQRRKEQLSSYSRCPDGGCPESCAFTAVAEGRAGVLLEHEESHEYRVLSVGWLSGEGDEKIARNECPHDDLPVAFYPGASFLAHFPADVVTPLTEAPNRPAGGAEPAVTDAMDRWPRMFEEGVVELNDEWDEPLGRIEVQRVCDGGEIWDRGSAECQQKWKEYMALFGHVMPVAPWERGASRK